MAALSTPGALQSKRRCDGQEPEHRAIVRTASFQPPAHAYLDTLMKTFHCDACRQLVFFENTLCVQCQHRLAYIPPLGRVAALEATDEEQWTVVGMQIAKKRFRLCSNYTNYDVCNWAVEAEDPNRLCQSCRLTTVIPNLDASGHREAWFKLERAKRRMLYTLMDLGCPLVGKHEDPERGLAYQFLSATGSGEGVLTGHDNGLITVNLAEADDTERERRRVRLHEPYRTLLGHFRHEIGHYYWDRLIMGQSRLEAFRALFGDERVDYQQALGHHYEQGPPANWEEHFISAYATTHPWEDWAESWAHYMHMVDMLDTAGDAGLALQPLIPGEPVLQRVRTHARAPFEKLIDSWFPLTYILNNLNRSMGLPDGYPFVLAPAVIEKLRFVHETIG
jgi:hypothetical protein